MAVAVAARRRPSSIFVATLLGAAPVLWYAYADDAAFGGGWPWSSVAVATVMGVLSAPLWAVTVPALLLLVLAFVGALSWGVQTPSLMAGSRVVAGVAPLARRSQEGAGGPKIPASDVPVTNASAGFRLLRRSRMCGSARLLHRHPRPCGSRR